MRFIYIVIALFIVLYGLNYLSLVVINRPWYRLNWVRHLRRWTPPLALACGLFWLAGALLDWVWLTAIGAGLLSSIYLYLLGLLIAQFVAGPIHLGEQFYDWRRRPHLESGPPSPQRRRFLRFALASIPVATTTVATGGIIRAATPAHIPQIPMVYAGLPAQLAGLKILHLSDIHQGPYIHRKDVEELVNRAAPLAPDLVLVTGDICDHMPEYLDTLKIIETLAPPHGIFASLGNHEHFRGLQQVFRSFSRSNIALLVNEGLTLNIGGQLLYIAGADDPLYLRGLDAYQKLRGYVEKSCDGAPANAFHILMSHRSQALDYAASLGMELILSGHTHGFQIGQGGRSLFDTWMPERYIWGHYKREDSQLYTSAGVGHWFPFRLGCPPEAPLITLHNT